VKKQMGRVLRPICRVDQPKSTREEKKEASMSMVLDDVCLDIENDFSENFPAHEDSMASQPERIATLEEKVRAIEGHKAPGWKIFTAAVLAAVGWLGYITAQLNTISQRTAHLEGMIGNPLSATIKGLESPASGPALVANLNLVSAQIASSKENRAKPNLENVKRLGNTLTAVAEKHSDLPQAWKAVATLASYSTFTSSEIKAKPDCDVGQSEHVIERSEVGETIWVRLGSSATKGYVFKDCILHMDQLPPGNVTRGSGNLSSTSTQPKPVYFAIGDQAVLINCDIVLTDSGIADSPIVIYDAFYCKFQYQIDKTPASQARQFLLASLNSSTPGEFSLKLSS
jgi:hypothetical protein